MLGNTDTVAGGLYNGGLENVLRFLESWSGHTFHYTGSVIALWNSIHADTQWTFGDPVYTAPIRDMSFDTNFLDIAGLPPETPRAYTMRVVGWNRPH